MYTQRAGTEKREKLAAVIYTLFPVGSPSPPLSSINVRQTLFLIADILPEHCTLWHDTNVRLYLDVEMRKCACDPHLMRSALAIKFCSCYIEGSRNSQGPSSCARFYLAFFGLPPSVWLNHFTSHKT